MEMPLEIIDISMIPEEEKKDKVREIHSARLSRPFDLSCPPLVYSTLVKCSEDHWEFLWVFHHIITDGTSQEILLKELMKIGSIALGEDETELEPLVLRYRDFAVWQRARVARPSDKEEAIDYWKSKLAEGFPELSLPFDYDGDPEDHRAFAFRSVAPLDILTKLEIIRRDHHTTLFMIMFTAINLYFSRLTGLEDIVLRVPESGRDIPGVINLMGYFVNTMIVKNHIGKTESFVQLMERISVETVEAFKYRWYPLEQAVEDLQIPFPKINVSFNMMTMLEMQANMNMESTEQYFIYEERLRTKFPLNIRLIQYRDGIEIIWDAQSTFFKPSTLKNMAIGFIELLESLSDE